MRISLSLCATVGLALCFGAPLAGQAAAAAPTGEWLMTQHPTAPAAAERPLERKVSLDLRDARLGDALKEINRQARLGLAYTPRVVDVERRVTLQAREITAGAALDRVLEGTGARAEETAAGTIVLVKSEAKTETSARQAVGVIYGQVTDTAGDQRVAGAQVMVQHTDLAATTNDSGFYAIRDVPTGQQTVVARLIGYRPMAQVVTVADSQAVRVNFALTPSPTRLAEVVSTATGDRRRLELGNDITLLRVDSIVAAEPITSITDLLEGRVPGMVVQRTSGAPGDPARIRLRGTSSPLMSNDPIVIVDGVRVYAEQSGERGANLAGSGIPNYAAPSPLDYLDPHSIETIEVLKGPSAATLYGQDAANGVIVVTTKKGQAGPARWHVSAERGVTQMPGSYPDLHLRWGHLYADNTMVFCPINNRSGGAANGAACEADSVVTFQMLSDPELTVLDRGHRTAATVGVSGGSQALTYNVTGSYRDEVGLVALPAYERDRYRELRGAAPPDWMNRPQNLTQWGASSRLTARLGRTADVSLTANLSRTRQQRSALENQLGALMSTYLDRATGTYYERAPSSGRIQDIAGDDILSNYYERATATATQFTNGVNVNWRPFGWLTATADAGLNIIQRSDEIFIPRGFDYPGTASIGRLQLGQGTSVMSTVNLRARAEAPLGHGFRFQFATGVNYTGRSVSDLKAYVRGLAEGTESLNGAATIQSLTQGQTDQATFGWYVEPGISHKRFWLSTGLRLDGGSSFGTNLSLPSFPKLSFSYLISDEPFFPQELRSVFNTLRLRVAYGQAGRQPGPTDRLRLYGARSQLWADGEPVEGVVLERLGNAELKPERSTEFEWGFDTALLDDRISLSLTGYRKTTTDALLDVPVAPSVYGRNVTILDNIGVVRNTGFEVMLGAQPLRTDPVTWSFQVALSQQRNVVVELGPGVEPFYTEGGAASGIRVAPGYPLFGRWSKPILGYADADEDGVLEPSEVLLGDTLVYVGTTSPNYTANLHSTVSLLRGAVSVSASLLYQDGLTQRNEVSRLLAPFSRGWNDSSASLAEQAAMIDVTEYNWIQTVNSLRLNSLAVTYNVPSRLARRLGARALSLAVQGTNLGLWTNYRGLDPNVNARVTGNNVTDTGILPQPRTWQLRVNATY